MHIRRMLVHGLAGFAQAGIAVACSVFVQSLFRVPARYTASICALALLACSFVVKQNRSMRMELIMSVVWTLLVAWYLPQDALLVMFVYVAVRLIGEIASIFFSQVDRVFGVMVTCGLGLVLLTTVYALLLDIRWEILAMCSVAFMLVLWLLFRRYDMLGSEE